MMSCCLGMALGADAGGAPAPAVINPNLLTKTERFDDAAWIKTNCTVTADAGPDPLGGTTADLLDLSFGVGAAIGETSAVACTTATGSRGYTLTAALARYSVTGSVDGVPYTYSLWLMDAAAPGIQIRFDVAGGFVKVSVKDIGDGATPFAWGAKLEIGSTATGDAATYGAVA